MASDEFSLQTLPEGDSSEELRRFVNGMVCNLPVKDTHYRGQRNRCNSLPSEAVYALPMNVTNLGQLQCNAQLLRWRSTAI